MTLWARLRFVRGRAFAFLILTIWRHSVSVTDYLSHRYLVLRKEI
jgi:hypothetical protein